VIDVVRSVLERGFRKMELKNFIAKNVENGSRVVT